MPLKIYCPNVNCAEPILYELTKPIACPFCGNRFDNVNIASQTTQKPKIKSIIKQVIEEDDDIDNEDNENLDINISSLQLETPIDTKKDKGVSLGEVIKQQKTGFVREKVKKVNKKKEFESFLEGARNNKKPIEIIDNSKD
jgi:uncharacterized Zn finger protein (UPF0148 family)